MKNQTNRLPATWCASILSLNSVPFAVFLAAVAIAGCDVEDDGKLVGSRTDEFLNEEASDESSIEDREREPDSPAPSTPNFPVQQQEDPQLGLSPTCGLGTVALTDCDWEKVTMTSGTTARADCSGQVVVSGGCWTGTAGNITVSSPDEGSQSNLPEDGDPWTTSTADGWSCEFSASASMTNTHRAVALCCSLDLAATCM